LVQVFVTQAASTIEELERMGMLFEREASGKGFFPEASRQATVIRDP